MGRTQTCAMTSTKSIPDSPSRASSRPGGFAGSPRHGHGGGNTARAHDAEPGLSVFTFDEDVARARWIRHADSGRRRARDTGRGDAYGSCSPPIKRQSTAIALLPVISPVPRTCSWSRLRLIEEHEILRPAPLAQCEIDGISAFWTRSSPDVKRAWAARRRLALASPAADIRGTRACKDAGCLPVSRHRRLGRRACRPPRISALEAMPRLLSLAAGQNARLLTSRDRGALRVGDGRPFAINSRCWSALFSPEPLQAGAYQPAQTDDQNPKMPSATPAGLLQSSARCRRVARRIGDAG